MAARQDVWPSPLRKKVGLETAGLQPLEPICGNGLENDVTASRRILPKAKIMKKVPFSFALSRISSGDSGWTRAPMDFQICSLNISSPPLRHNEQNYHMSLDSI